MSTRSKGDISEAKVLSILQEMGYSVLLPFGEGLKYDLAVDVGDNILRIQVKRMWQENGAYVLQCCSSSNSIKDKRAYTSDEIDGFIGHNPKDDYMCWVPVSEAPSKSMRIRFQEPNNSSPNINWDSDYRLETNFR